MDMKDTVLDLLAPEDDRGSFDNLSIYESLKNGSLNKTDALELTDKVLEIIDNGADSNQLLHNLSLLHIAKRSGYYHEQRVMLEGMTLAIDYHLNPNADTLLQIKEMVISAQNELTKTAARDELNNKFATAELAMNYLEGFFGDDLIEEVVELTGVSKATVKRYQSGSNPRRRAHDLLTRMAKMFFAFSETKTKEEIVDFYKNETILDINTLGAVSVRDYLIKYHSFSYMITNALKDNYDLEDIY
jgi:hypothetical protein